MPELTLTRRADAPVEEVWKLLHDPSRFPEWWAGIETVSELNEDRYTMWPAGYPDFPMGQELHADRGRARVTISCLVSNLVFSWQLGEAGDRTDIVVHLELPDNEAHRLDGQREILEASLGRLCVLAAGGHVVRGTRMDTSPTSD